MLYTKIKITFCLLLLTQLSWSQGLQWSDPIIVNDDYKLGDVRPRIALNSDASPIVIWGKQGASKSIHVSVFSGGSFSTPVQLVDAEINPYIGSLIGPEIAIYNDVVYISLEGENSNGEEHIYLLASSDGGNTFSDTIRVEDVANNAVLPNVAVTDSGNPVVSFMHVNSSWSNTNQMLTQSFDSGNTFEEEVSASEMSNNQPCECCFSKVVVDGDTYVVVLRDNDNNVRNMYASISYDSGQTFSEYVLLDGVDWNLNACPDAGPDAYISDGFLYAVWRSGATGNNLIHSAKLNLSNQVLEVSSIVDNVPSILQKMPDIAGNKDTVAVVWTDNRDNINDCFLSFSTDGMDTWSESVAFSDTSVMANFNEPDVAFKNGVIHMVYRNISTHQVLYRTATIGDFSGLNKEVVSSDFQFYPNPVSKHLFLKEKAEYAIYNSKGKKVLSGYSSEVDVQSLSKGSYLIKMNNSVHKFIKK